MQKTDFKSHISQRPIISTYRGNGNELETFVVVTDWSNFLLTSYFNSDPRQFFFFCLGFKLCLQEGDILTKPCKSAACWAYVLFWWVTKTRYEDSSALHRQCHLRVFFVKPWSQSHNLWGVHLKISRENTQKREWQRSSAWEEMPGVFESLNTLLSIGYVTFLSGKWVLAAVQENVKVVPLLTWHGLANVTPSQQWIYPGK